MYRSVLALLALAPFTAQAATLTVGPAGTYATINDALANASDGDVIEVEAGDYNETLQIDNLDIEIVGVAGSGSTRLTGSAPSDLVQVFNGATLQLSGFELVNNSPRALNVFQATLAVTDVLVAGFDITVVDPYDDGSGLNCTDSNVQINDSTFDANNADDGSHVRLTGCSLLVSNGTFLGGTSSDDGGAFRVDDSDVVILDSWFEGNNAANEGGAIFYNNVGTLEITGSTFANNTSGGLGGAIRVGGGQGFEQVTVTIADTTFAGNQSTGSLGGAVYHRGTGDLSVVDSVFEGNIAADNGGGIRFFPDGTVTGLFERNLFLGNDAGDIGGGIAAASSQGQARVEAYGNDFRGNSSVRGGGLSVEAAPDVVVIGNTFCGNDASSSGGGLRVTNAGANVATFTNNVFIENTAGAVGGGLSLFASGFGPALQFVNNTWAGNDGPDGGNIYVDDASADFQNNIIAFALGGGGMFSNPGVPGTLDYNLWFDNAPADTSGALQAGDLGGNAVFADPTFALFTQDGVCGNDLLTLDPGSPAIDAGNPAPAFDDPDGSQNDIGAYGGPDVPPGATEDADGDGWPAIADCDDNDYDVNPNAQEVCDGIDNNCDGGVDDALAPGATDWFPDADGDGFGNDAAPVTACYAPPGFIDVGGDCNDANDTVNPNGTELCDQLDNNCDGTIDEGLTDTWYDDVDGDGFGDAGAATDTCDGAPAGTVDNGDDCDDGNADVYPGAEEVCDELDNNCDGSIDEGLVQTWYRDVDADGFGDDENTREECVQPGGHVPQGGDCDDGNPDVNPAADDLTADGIDQDCDGGDGKKTADEDLVAISGCACSSATGSSSAGWLAVLGLAALVRRRQS